MAQDLTEPGAGSSDKLNKLFMILSGIFLTNAILAEIIGVKIFSAEATLGLPYAQIPLLEGYILDFNLTAGSIIWPIVFITTDIINEYFGIKGVKRISYLTAGLIAYVFAIMFIATELEPATFWLEVNKQDTEGNPLNFNVAFNSIFRQGMGIIVGSLVAFLLGQLLDAWVFQKLRRITGSALLLTPLLYIAHGIIDRYLGKAKAEEVISKTGNSKTMA